MEQIPQRIEARTDAEWNAAWNVCPHVPKLIRQLSGKSHASHRESLMQAAYFAAGKLHDEDFHMFTNGGQPLLRRQRELWCDEILFHAPPQGTPGHYSPATVEVMVSFEPLKDIRAKYSRSYSMVPAFVAKANLGQFQDRACRTIWNLERQESIVEIATLLQSDALMWIEDLCDPLSLEDRVIQGTLPFVDDATALELVLAVGGKIGARRVVSEWRSDPLKAMRLETEVKRLSCRFGPVYRSDSIDTNIAVLCICYDLWPKQRLRAG